MQQITTDNSNLKLPSDSENLVQDNEPPKELLNSGGNKNGIMSDIAKRVVDSTSICKFRCPECLSLYEVNSNKIMTVSPEFECPKCQCHFGFDYPPNDFSAILTYKISPLIKEHQRNCPKCQHMQKESLEICESCGVVIENFVLLQNEVYPKVSVELIKMWQKLISDYDNPEKHLSFINRCFKLNSPDYALFKYQELSKNIKQNNIESWIQLIKNKKEKITKSSLLAEVKNENKLKIDKKEILSLAFWQRVLPWLPVMLALGFILFGFLTLAHRNSIGVGIFLMILSLGFIVFRQRG